MAKLSETQFRSTVGTFPTGVTVVTTRNGQGQDFGLTLSAFASLSLAPLMVVVSIQRSAATRPHLTPGAPVAISILSSEQTEVALTFSRHGVDRFAQTPIVRASNGAALIDGALSHLVGTVSENFDAGDHVLCTVLVEEAQAFDREPLVYHKGALIAGIGKEEPGR